ncbi:sensor histidine kinase [Pseudomonas sp. H11T01]|uniref:sensor histidine kinase n=1 Tax=Pseudomonas sp. H11T01 TaxID=3402749 RepID=UPI003AC78FAE
MRPGRWTHWLLRSRPRQVDSVRALLAELPLRLADADDALSHFLDRFEALNPGSKLGLLLTGEDFGPTRRAMLSPCDQTSNCPWRAGAVTAVPQRCTACQSRGRYRLLSVLPGIAPGRRGVLLLDTPRAAGRGFHGLLGETARGLGVGVQLLRHKREQQCKEATFQHGALARELHDSVAQQLGYLSFQASLMQGKLREPEQAAPLLAELRGGLSHLQRQVRELITSARLTMDGRSLRQALADSVAEFSRRCIIVFELDNRLAEDALYPETELQILQIIREALANVVRHSHARHVRIELRQAQGEITVTVEDDGIGLSPASVEENHFGLVIIRERASTIGAQLTIETIRPHGARVHLSLIQNNDDPQRHFDEQHDLIVDR